MLKLATKKDCTGCAACANVCSKSAITMQADEEGFLQPYIDVEQCVECGLCEKRCPALHPLNPKPKEQRAYAIINFADRKLSSSGGAFSLFARYVLNQGGAVFGATIDEKLQVFHTKIEKVDDLKKLRGSKYVQSDIGDIYQEVKKELRAEKNVLFCGSPCQVAGLYAFLGQRNEDKLITLDLVCHGVPNQAIFNAYLRKLKNSPRLKAGEKNIEEFRFRKLDSWSIVPAVKFAKSKWQRLEQEDNAYMSAFFRGITYRESCFKCRYANLNRVGDFTIADFWGIGRHGKTFKKNVASGVSLVLDNRGKMAKLHRELEKNTYIEEREVSEAVVENCNLHDTVKRLPERNSAIKDMLDDSISLRTFGAKYHLLKKENWMHSLVKYGKDLIYALGLYNVYKTLIYKIGK